MRVLFATYALAFQNPGGGEQVARALERELGKLGVHVDFYDPWHHDPQAYDVVHYFSCLESSFWLQAGRRRGGPPLVVTPTLWQTAGPRSWLAYGKQLALRRLERGFDSLASSRLERFALPDLYLPTTATEAERLNRFWEVGPERTRILPNGVDAAFATGDPRLFREHFKIDDPFVLHVGRFHPVKNQHTLIAALGKSGLRGVFVGSADIGQDAYYRHCLDAAAALSGRVRFIPAVAHDDPLLASAYAAAAVFALPSEFETFGISALEAAVAGAPLVLTENIWSRPVFAGARFVRPGSVGTLARALTESVSSRPAVAASGVGERLLASHRWDNIARTLTGIYEDLLRS